MGMEGKTIFHKNTYIMQNRKHQLLSNSLLAPLNTQHFNYSIYYEYLNTLKKHYVSISSQENCTKK